MWTTNRVLLGNAGDREWLAGKAGQQDIMFRNVFFDDFADVSSDS